MWEWGPENEQKIDLQRQKDFIWGKGGADHGWKLVTEMMETKAFLQDLQQNCNPAVSFDGHQSVHF